MIKLSLYGCLLSHHSVGIRFLLCKGISISCAVTFRNEMSDIYYNLVYLLFFSLDMVLSLTHFVVVVATRANDIVSLWLTQQNYKYWNTFQSEVPTGHEI